jgi:hypothetical protein
MRHKHFESHPIPEKLVGVTSRKAGLAHTNCLDHTSTTQLFENLKNASDIVDTL